MKELLTDLFSTITIGAVVVLVAALFKKGLRAKLERSCVGQATAADLAFARIVVCAVLLITVLSEDLPSIAKLDVAWFHWPGYLAKFLDTNDLAYFVTSAPRLTALTWLLVAALVLGLFGVFTRVTLPIAAVLYILFGALLRGYGKYFHDGYLAGYVITVLCFVPAGDAWSVDARWIRPLLKRKVPDRGNAYSWALWACFAALSIPYLQLAASKLAWGGLYWFDGRSLRNYMLTDDLNLTQWEIDLALRAYKAPTIFFTIAGFFAIVAEAIYPAVLVWPRLRRYVPACLAALHAGVWLGQDAWFIDATLMPLIFLRPGTRRDRGEAPEPAAAPAPWRGVLGYAIPLVLVTGMNVLNYITFRNVCKYQWPIEGWQMYAAKSHTSRVVNYRRFLAHRNDGTTYQTNLGEAVPFLVGPYRVDSGLSHDVPGLLIRCLELMQHLGVGGLTYETRSWYYRRKTLEQHYTDDAPNWAYRIDLVPEPSAELRTALPAKNLLTNADFEGMDLAIGVPIGWKVPEANFLGVGVDPKTKKRSVFVARIPVPKGEPAAPPQVIEQSVELPPIPEGMTATLRASVLARTKAAGAALAIDVPGDGNSRPAPAADQPAPPDATSAAAPGSGQWQRLAVEYPVALPTAATALTATVRLIAAGDTHFDDAALELVLAPAPTPAPAPPGAGGATAAPAGAPATATAPGAPAGR